MPFYERGPVRIHYEEVGSGFPLLLIPGGGLNSSFASWDTASPFKPMERYKDDFRCICADLRNANPGQSSGPLEIVQSLSVGVVSALNRDIQSLTNFPIGNAIQTDAAINHGNSGGPLLDGSGKVIGINSQIRSTGGGGEGVGFAIPVETVTRAVDQLRMQGHVDYA